MRGEVHNRDGSAGFLWTGSTGSAGPGHAAPVDLGVVARQQCGLFTRAQARAAGHSDDAVDRQLTSGRWRRAHSRVRGVFLAATDPLTPDALPWLFVLAAGPPSAVGAASAAWLWGWCAAPPRVTVVVPRERQPRLPLPAVVRRLELPAADVTTVGRLPVTTRERTLADALRFSSAAEAGDILDRALQRHRVDLALVAQRIPTSGYGTGQARRLLAASDAARFAAERLAGNLLRRHRVRGWRANHPLLIGGRRVVIDIAFVAERVAVEIDGWAYHSDVSRFRRDRSRQNLLVRDGWLVLRYTWADLTQRPDEVVAEVVAAVQSRRR